LNALPVDAYLPHVDAALEAYRAVVVVAEPGAGKRTRFPPHLAGAGPLLLLQPRRAAARAIASRIAEERRWTIGREVGWQIRLERRYGADTGCLVATEGILTARLQQDPLLSGFHTLILDEFHERSIHSDLGLALAKEAWLARDDLRLVVMSATMDADAVSRYLNDCPILSIPGTAHALEISYAPTQSLADAAAALVDRAEGDVLCFLPGAREIASAVSELRARVPGGVTVWPLHGTMGGPEQDQVLSAAAARGRRIIVATNIAETSLTVPGVRAVVDRGLQKVPRYDAARAIDSLSIERVTRDAADQRAGRAARTGPGLAVRLWDERDRLQPHREAEVHRVDLSPAVLAIAAWGGSAKTFAWFEPPRAEALERASELLERLGALQDGAATEIGRTMQRLPLHPRLARILIAGSGDRGIARACAILSERPPIADRRHSTVSDVLSALDAWHDVPLHVRRIAEDLERSFRAVVHPATGTPLNDEEVRRAILAGYPDRVGQRRHARSPRVKLASGTGAVVVSPSGVSVPEYLVALDVQASTRKDDPDSVIRMATGLEREWLMPTRRERRHWMDDGGTIRAAIIERYDALVLSEKPVAPEAGEAHRLLVDAWFDRPRTEKDDVLLRRLTFAGGVVDLRALVASAAFGRRSLSEIDLHEALPHEVRLAMERDAPASLIVPSGRAVPLTYTEDGGVAASVKLQELFGLAETPRIGTRRTPVLLSLLAPSGRPVQTTRDLRSFWDRTYPDVRRELRGRYPRHPWPEDPWTALPTAKTKKASPRRR
jgi:ATP-dependent helicase HrpB